MHHHTRWIAGAACAVAFAAGQALASNSSSAATTQQLDRALTVAEDLSVAFEHASSVVAPSVVNVRAATRISATPNTRRMPFPQPFAPSPFREFFGDDFFQRFARPMPPGAPNGILRQGQGTGFVVSEDGYILTNNHVVADASIVTVQFASGPEHDAQVVGVDPCTDLALLKIDEEGQTPVRFADSDALRVGSWVVE